MARHNKLGTSFCSLELEAHEEKVIKLYLKDKGISAKHLLRFLIRKHIKDEKL
jgi:hypothetical protein